MARKRWERKGKSKTSHPVMSEEVKGMYWPKLKSWNLKMSLHLAEGFAFKPGIDGPRL